MDPINNNNVDETETETEADQNPDISNSSEFVPPDSFWLSKDSEFDWFDRNAFLERLPKTQKNTHVDMGRRSCKPANTRLFPKQKSTGGRGPVAEPSSPKVSCIGRVRSKRCPNRRKPAGSVAQPVIQEKGEKTGFMSRITGLFHGSKKRKSKSKAKVNEQLEKENSYSRRNNVTVKPVNSEPESPPEPPVLGGMNRFASGRRGESWADDIHNLDHLTVIDGRISSLRPLNLSDFGFNLMLNYICFKSGKSPLIGDEDYVSNLLLFGVALVCKAKATQEEDFVHIFLIL
ncbi:hypothetical protein CTI12_AA306010 [Artemisia annua]|uniref:Uncharacterized protein n=1 Tax=Artemisia annua TaxID=35608 RepID=A0A2U1M0S8_ARTAN|nr:hypothetical protein CTI12_AA306010 [Artemisia annua]